MAAKKKGTVKEVMEQTEQAIEQPQAVQAGLVAFAPFELDGQQYAKGEAVVLSKKFTRDLAFDEQRKVDGSSGKGLAFLYESEPLKLGKNADGTPIVERQWKRVIIPVKE